MFKKVTLLLCVIYFSLSLSAKENPLILMETSKGDIIIELFEESAPVTVENMLNYIRNDHYNGTIFHRVIKDFMIQGGGFTEKLRQKPTGKEIKNEATNRLENKRGTIAMARTPAVNSATAQFFINTRDNYALNHKNTSARGYGYCVFGKVINGMDVVDTIENSRVKQKHYFQHLPTEPIVIESISILRESKSKKT